MSKNPDYTESAVKLCNPEQTQAGLEALAIARQASLAADEALKGTLEYQTAKLCAGAVAEITNTIHGLIDSYGSYQLPDNGDYAVKQRKVTMIYSPSMVKSRLPELAGDIITVTEAVDKKVIERLVKDGFTSQEAVDQCGRGRESFIYIIEAGGQDAASC